MSRDFGLFCVVNQNLRTWHFLVDLLGNRSLLKQVQKVMVCDLWLVNFDPFCVFVAFELQSLCVFVKSSKFSRSLPCRSGRFVLWCSLVWCKLSCFSSRVLLPSYWNMASLDSQGEIVPVASFQIQKQHRVKTNRFLPTFNFAASAHYFCLNFINKDWLLW